MITNSIKLCILTVAFLAAVVTAQVQKDKRRETVAKGISINEIRDYRNMLRVNKEPVDMVEETKAMCAPPSSLYGPHYNPGVVYYINEIARQGITTYSDEKMFPVGSIIVKEKQERRTEDSVQIITVMKKLHSSRSDVSWEYKMYDTKKWTEIDVPNHTSGSLSRTCIECHRRYKENDYVSDKGIELLLRK